METNIVMSEFMWGFVTGAVVVGLAQFPLMRLVHWQRKLIDALKEGKIHWKPTSSDG